jgi:CHASE1-domain containing sensor protein
MIQLHLARFFVSAILFFAISFGATWFITPQSFVNFVGPSAAVVSGLLLIWRITPLFAVLLVSPLVAFSLDFYFDLDTSLAVIVISMLAITLQGFWTQQLVHRFIQHKKWLSSRKHLFFFLMRVGPLPSFVSATAVLALTILDSKVINGGFLYAFVNTWSASMLVAVFFIPLLLLVRNAEKIKVTKRIVVGFISILGGFAILLLFKTSQYEQQTHRQMLFNQSQVEIERLISDEIESVVKQIHSLSAFFKASESVSLTEFTVFSESIYKKDSSVRALEWAPIVPFSQKDNFEQQSAKHIQKNFRVRELSANGEMTLAESRIQYAPLLYIYPKQGNEAALGLDVYSNPSHVLPMQNVVNSKEIIAGAPITLVQDEQSKPGILFSYATFKASKNNKLVKGTEQSKRLTMQDNKLFGFVIAVVQFDDFFQQLAKKKEKEVSLFIQDISSNVPATLFGQQAQTPNRHTITIAIEVFSRNWQVTITEKQPWFSQEKSWKAWAVLIGGTFGALLFQMLVLMMAAYSSELGQQVEIKTRALILAKESSDKKSLAKSHFLQTLNSELRLPLLAMKAFVEQLKQKGINNKEVTGISHAGSNVALLLDTMMDLSDIESGKIKAKNDCFDFYGFLQRTELVLKASNGYEGKSIFFLIDESVPHYINSDELYIQKLLNALIESAHHLLQTDALRLSIKLHTHKLAEASLFFTLSSQHAAITNSDEEIVNADIIDNELTTDSTALAMAIKYSQLLKGDTHLGALSTGAGVLNSSIRVSISSVEQQEIQQGLTFDLMS